MSTDSQDPTMPKHDLHWYAETCGVTVEQIRLDLGLAPSDDAIRRNSVGCAALDDIISHAGDLLSAMESRIRLAKSEDANQVKSATLEGEEFHGPADDNESYWKRMRDVVGRIIHQARFARGQRTS